MKKLIFIYAIYFILIFTFPAVIISIGNIGITKELDTGFSYRLPQGGRTVKVYNHITGEAVEMDIEEYLCGVVAAEMPVTFPLEALKAQAVAARSYLNNKLANGSDKIEKHHGCDICTDSTHCKAWISKDDRMKKWDAANAENYWSKICASVSDTKGEIMVYNGEPVNAVFYAISSGKTERAVDVWQSDIPYLQSVDSQVDENAPGYLSTAEFTYDEFKTKMKSYDAEVSFSENPQSWYSNEIRSEGGGVKTCKIGGKTFKGSAVRTALGLRSANFTVSITDSKFVFNVKGYGHGVGMSQWGAKFYAEQGKSYRDILRLYYTGVSFSTMQ